MREIPGVAIDFRSPEIQKNPYPAYDYLLKNHPVFKLPDDRVGICRHADVLFALNNQELFTVGSPTVVDPDWKEEKRGMFILTQDNPAHDLNKAVVNKAFVSRVLRQLEGFMRQRATSLLNETKGKHIEFFQGFGYPYANSILGAILGTADTQDRHMEQVYRWIELLEQPDLDRPEDERVHETNAAYKYLGNWYVELTAERRKHPRNDLITALIEAEVEGKPLTENDVFGAIDLFLIAGFQSTAQFLASTLLFLAENGDILARLKENQAEIPGFIEEMLRFGGTAHAVLRIARTNVELHGYIIPEGTLVAIFLAAANRDPLVFENPEKFILGRSNVRRQIGFGAGHHACIGAALARLEVKIALEIILSECDKIACPAYSDVEWLQTPTTRGAKSLPIVFS